MKKKLFSKVRRALALLTLEFAAVPQAIGAWGMIAWGAFASHANPTSRAGLAALGVLMQGILIFLHEDGFRKEARR